MATSTKTLPFLWLFYLPLETHSRNPNIRWNIDTPCIRGHVWQYYKNFHASTIPVIPMLARLQMADAAMATIPVGLVLQTHNVIRLHQAIA